MNNNKTFSVNGILIFEPRYMSGIYAALSQDYGIDNGLKLNSSKGVIKIRVGIRLNK
ncbi:MAG: hypothetical protein GWP03_06640 [Proteobacteria bacterium]|nr:hypothetical protein [Pseudomonadota bacterium]